MYIKNRRADVFFNFLDKRFQSFAIFALLMGLGFLFTWTFGVNFYDEVWFLRIIHRMRGREALYRDMSFGTNPISVYLTMILTFIGGTEILVVKFMQALCFASCVFLCIQISRILYPRKKWPWFLIGFLCVYCPAYPNSLYTPLGTVFFMGTLYTILKWIQTIKHDNIEKSFRHSQLWLIWSGVFAGLTFGTKQNYGGVTLLALFGVLSFVSTPQSHLKMRWFWIRITGGAFLVTVLLTTVLPIFLTDSINAYWKSAIMKRIEYIDHARFSYFTNFHSVLEWMKPSFFLYVRNFYGLLFFIFPFVVLPLLFYSLFWGWGPRTQKPEVLISLFWGIASILNVYPRFDFSHIVYSVPAMLIGAETVWIALRDRLNPFFQRVILWVLVLWLCPGIVQFIGRPIKRVLVGYYSVSDFPHFRYALLSSQEYNHLKSRTEMLNKDILNPRKVLLLK